MDHAVAEFLALFNRSVRTGDWAAYARAFTEDALVEFENVPVPAMQGRRAIEDGYREAPPDDTITALDCRTDGNVHEVTYRWDVEGTGGGRLRLTMRDGLVAHNLVTLTQDVTAG